MIGTLIHAKLKILIRDRVSLALAFILPVVFFSIFAGIFGGGTGGGQGAASSMIMPPRLPSAASLPALLASAQAEYDALLLELYDARRALEDTRRELSQALYQNDASVRVVARLERAARERQRRRICGRRAPGGAVVA